MRAFHIISQLDLVHPGSIGLIFLLPFPKTVERSGLEDITHYVWAGSGPGEPSDVPGGLKNRLSLFPLHRFDRPTRDETKGF